MSESKSHPFYTRESHPHTGDPRVDPLARRIQSDNQNSLKLFSEEAFESPEVAKKQEEKIVNINQEQQLPIQPTVRIEELIIKGKKKQKITLNEGTRDEIVHTGRIYGLQPQVAIRSLPAERRGSEVIHVSQSKDAFFKVDGGDTIENGVPYFRGIVVRNNGIGKLPTLITPGYINKWDVQKTSRK